MQAGRLRQRITLQHKPAEVEGSAGYVAGDWATAREEGPFWAASEEGMGLRFFRAQQIWSATSVVFTIRYQPGVTFSVEDRIVWGDRTFTILGAYDPDGGRREFVIACKDYAE